MEDKFQKEKSDLEGKILSKEQELSDLNSFK